MTCSAPFTPFPEFPQLGLPNPRMPERVATVSVTRDSALWRQQLHRAAILADPWGQLLPGRGRDAENGERTIVDIPSAAGYRVDDFESWWRLLEAAVEQDPLEAELCA